ncbi:hypothetical protein POSPLADRAFT_1041579 [Postia placenta MAD-698-R-SB12]|uniref:Uncharacterized protein n=1 Tax=Postia placenta MAD-698-R-SB12 TaxID=670580 RepID=A0A1X6MN67_9APHY|nr:hypothetical protein POSPLADRAFT_1041579 [Postia placenta MAD-698-R-SB12]OSX57632.1 hypothetical protein POSPLADRAFT_1041579 [Postia placenta MAD-698-R-SB12]
MSSPLESQYPRLRQGQGPLRSICHVRFRQSVNADFTLSRTQPLSSRTPPPRTKRLGHFDRALPPSV